MHLNVSIISVLTLIVIVLMIGFIIFFIKFWEMNSFMFQSYLRKGHVGGESEFAERNTAFKFTKPDASVLEFGGGAGSVSAVIQLILKNKQNHVVVQPKNDPNAMYGGVNQLALNKKNFKYEYQIVDEFLKEGQAPKIQKMVSKNFDTIVCDCENCLVGEYQKNPELFEFVTQIQVERDDPDKSYTDFLQNTLKLKRVHKNHYHPHGLAVEVWEKE